MRASPEPALGTSWDEEKIRVLSGSSLAAKCQLECGAGPQERRLSNAVSFLPERAISRDEAGSESGKRKAVVFKVSANGRRDEVTLKCRKAYFYFLKVILFYVYMCLVCMPVWVATCVPGAFRGTELGALSSVTGLTGYCEPPCG